MQDSTGAPFGAALRCQPASSCLQQAKASVSRCRIAEALATGIWDDTAFANYVAIVEHGSSKMVGGTSSDHFP